MALGSSRDLPRDKLRKSYEEINNYLEKKIKSDDIETNMAKAEELLANKKSSLNKIFGVSKSMVESLELLIEFSKIPSNSFQCQNEGGRKLMEEIDSGLVHDEGSKIANYPLSRLDKIIQYYAFENALRCDFGDTNSRRWPKMNYGFKSLAYDEIDRLLVDKLPETDDVETNMAKANELLESLTLHDGALGNALEQLLELKSTLNENTCNKQGFKILFKNDLATRGQVHKWSDEPLRRVDKLYKYYAKKHEEICRPVIRDKFKIELKKLDSTTYSRVLGLIGSQYVMIKQYFELVRNVHDETSKREFSIPLFVKEAERMFSKYGNDSSAYELDTFKLYHYLIAAKSGKRGSKYLNSFDNKEVEIKYRKHVREIVTKYVIEPCINYLDVFRELIKVDEYGWNMNMNHFASTLNEFVSDITYHMVHAGYQLCKFVDSHKELIYDHIKHYSIEHKRYEELLKIKSSAK